MLSKHQTLMLQEALERKLQGRIAAGPFQNLRYPLSASIDSGTAKLLGSYEEPLHAWLSEACRNRYDEILYAGGKDGFYPALLAARIPGAIVHAVFQTERGRAAAAELAAHNGVGERLHVSAAASREVWEHAPRSGRRRLAFIDGDEASLGLLQRIRTDERTDVLVEYLGCEPPGPIATFAKRLEATHDIAERKDAGQRQEPRSGVLAGCSQLEQLLARWEWRRNAPAWLWGRGRRAD